MKSIVTGGGGFLGSYIVRALVEQGKEVVSLSRGKYSELEHPSVTQVQADLKDLESLKRAFKGASEVFHVAAKVGIWGKWKDFYQTNVVGTENVLKACKANRISKLIFTSSPSVVFGGSDQKGVDESSPYPQSFLSPYPHSKSLAEKLVLSENGKDGLFTVALRPHLIWGKGDRFLIPRVIEQAKNKKLLRVGDGKNLVDITHVRDAAQAHVDAAEKLTPHSEIAGKSYFLSQGSPLLLWNFIDKVLERAELPALRKSISFQTAYCLGASLESAYRLFASNKEPRMTRFLALQLAKDHYFDITAARRDLNYISKVSIEEGLDEMFLPN